MKEIRNILSWYPFKQNSNILEIGADNFYLTELLLNKAKSVTSIVFFDNIKEQYLFKDKYKNLEVISKKNLKLSVDKKYDYIILVDINKYFSTILPNSKNPFIEIFDFCKKYLSKDGKILLATDNRFGIKNFSGNQSDNEDYIFQNLEEKNENYKLYTKLELISIMKNFDFDFKFYYPFPNFKNVNVIFSEDYLPKGNNSKINYNASYDSKSKIILDENNLIKQLANNNLLDIFSNSFFIEIFNKNNKVLKNNIKYIGFNGFRKDKYKTLLVIKDKYAIKSAHNKEAIPHIKKIIDNSNRLKELKLDVLEESNDDYSIKTKYISKDNLLDSVLCESLENNNIKKFFEIIDLWIEKCLKKLEKDTQKDKIFNIRIDNNLSKEFTFLKDGFIDLMFENIFFINNEFIIYDQEWNFKNIPLEFLIFRGITNLYVHNSNLNKIINYEEVLKKYRVEKYIEIFNKVEQKIQEHILDHEVITKSGYSNLKVNLNELYQKSENYSKVIDDINRISTENNNLKNENINLSNENNVLKNENTNLNTENNNLKSENINLSNENNALKNENTNLNTENNNLKSENINLSIKNNELKNENINLNRDIISYKNELTELNKDLKVLQDYKDYIENLRMWKIIKKIFKYK